jgi:hypothetical protein
MTINNYYFPSEGDNELLTTILEKLNLLITKSNQMANEIATLEAEVAEMKTVQQSAVTLLQGLKQRLDEAGTDAVKLAALSADIDSSTNSLAAAVTANTPAENEPTTP